MSLINEKKRLYEIASNSKETIKFDSIDTTCNSYYIPYKKSKHNKDVLEYFSSQEFSDIQDHLDSLWDKNEDMKSIIPIILAAYHKSRLYDKNYLRDIELYNYMM